LYAPLTLARKYISYRLKALNGKGHGMHSPFVFRFILDVLNNRNGYKMPAAVNSLRAALLKDHTTLRVKELGAGSRRANGADRRISDIARSAVKPRKYTELLYRLAHHYRPQHMVELGTSLGVTTAALAMAVPEGRVVTIEGSPEVRAAAVKNFERLGIANIESVEGNFDDVLHGVLKKMPRVDLAFIDGNHRYAPTMRYFQTIMAHAGNETVLVFDDIHWSAEMEKAWADIKSDGRVRCTVDLFFIGIVWLRSEFKERQHFMIRY
jgi:predicted O-methyltransferase YrrM